MFDVRRLASLPSDLILFLRRPAGGQRVGEGRCELSTYCRTSLHCAETMIRNISLIGWWLFFIEQDMCDMWKVCCGSHQLHEWLLIACFRIKRIKGRCRFTFSKNISNHLNVKCWKKQISVIPYNLSKWKKKISSGVTTQVSLLVIFKKQFRKFLLFSKCMSYKKCEEVCEILLY